MSRKVSRSSSSLSKRGTLSSKSTKSTTTKTSSEINLNLERIYIEERDQMMKCLWEDIYDLAFRDIFDAYLGEQIVRFNIHCAVEACAKIITFNDVTKDTGEPITDEKIWGDDVLPETSPIDIMFENGGPWPADKLDMLYANDEGTIFMDGKMEIREGEATPLLDRNKFNKTAAGTVTFVNK